MECKFNCVIEFFLAISELIDTLWNVNAYHGFLLPGDFSELIDTLWNVNR